LENEKLGVPIKGGSDMAPFNSFVHIFSPYLDFVKKKRALYSVERSFSITYSVVLIASP